MADREMAWCEDISTEDMICNFEKKTENTVAAFLCVCAVKEMYILLWGTVISLSKFVPKLRINHKCESYSLMACLYPIDLQ